MNISISKVVSTTLEKGYRIIKVLQFGPKTADQCSSFGDDSNPLKDMTAIFCETAEKGEPVIIGYVQKDQLSAIGEKRIFSLKENGDLSCFVWLKNNEEIHINGDSDNFVKFTPLEQKLLQMVQDLNTELTKIQAGITGVGGVYAPQPISLDISSSKTEKIKTS